MSTLHKIWFALMIVFLTGNAALAESFSDVDAENPHAEAIKFLQQQGISKSSENFYPRRPISLSEFLVMGLISAGIEKETLPASAATRFTDVPVDSWFAPFVREADRLNLLSDFRSQKLWPNRPLTRGEAVKLGLEIFGASVPIVLPDEEFGFRDVRAQHRLARYIFRAVKMGVIDPVSDSKFGATQKLNRGEAAELFFQLANFQEGGGTTIVIRNGSRIPGWDLFETVWREAQDRFLFEQNLDEAEMLYSAIEGAIESLGDPYSAFLPPQKSDAVGSDLAGEVEGIGAFLSENKDGEVVVVSPIRDSPAERAGLRPGDIITAVDDKSVSGLSVIEVSEQIRGKSGTQVKITVRRAAQYKVFTITRAKVEIKSVMLEFQNDIAVITVSQFNSPTPSEFAAAAAEIVTANPRGIVLDLRNNGGGLVTSAIDMVGYFLPNDSLVASARYRPGLEKFNINYHTASEPLFDAFKTVVLINRGSASASEIVAAALQDYDRATIVGEVSFGKGTMQEINFFTNGTALKLTVAHWFSPNEQPINEVGITPDVEAVDDADTSTDEALNLVLELF